MAYVVMKEIFKYGVKNIVQKKKCIQVSLTYSPKNETLKNKFRNLPISYVRTNLEMEEEMAVSEIAFGKYKFQTMVNEQKDVSTLPPLPPLVPIAGPSTEQTTSISSDTTAVFMFPSKLLPIAVTAIVLSASPSHCMHEKFDSIKFLED